MPKATVRKNGQKVALALDQTPEFCKIKLKAVKRGDGGDYELELANEMGADKVPITIKVVGKCGSLSLVVRVEICQAINSLHILRLCYLRHRHHPL